MCCESITQSFPFPVLLTVPRFNNKLILTILVPIQGVSRFVDITAEDDFLGLCDQKSSYKHVSDFGWLRSYGHFIIPVHALAWTASYRTSWRVIYSTWQLIFCVVSIIFATFSRSSQPRGSLCCGRRWHFLKPALSTDQFKLKVISRR